jgi:hypothetical protein
MGQKLFSWYGSIAGDGILQPCGTSAAARRHARNDEPLDRSCLDAEARRMQSYRRRRKANGGKPLGGRWPDRTGEKKRAGEGAGA